MSLFPRFIFRHPVGVSALSNAGVVATVLALGEGLRWVFPDADQTILMIAMTVLACGGFVAAFLATYLVAVNGHPISVVPLVPPTLEGGEPKDGSPSP